MENDKIDKIINKLIEHDEKINQLLSRVEFEEFAKKTTDTLEDIATRVKRVDEDRILTYQWI